MSTSKPEFNDEIDLKSSGEDNSNAAVSLSFLDDIKNDRSLGLSDAGSSLSGANTKPEMMQVAGVSDFLPAWLGGTPEPTLAPRAAEKAAEQTPARVERSVLVNKEPTPAEGVKVEAPAAKGEERSILVKPEGKFNLPSLFVGDKAKDDQKAESLTPEEQAKQKEEEERERRAEAVKSVTTMFNDFDKQPFSEKNIDMALQLIKQNEPKFQTAEERETGLHARVKLADYLIKNERKELAGVLLNETLQRYPEGVMDRYDRRAFTYAASRAGMFKGETFSDEFEKAGGDRRSLYINYKMNAAEAQEFKDAMKPVDEAFLAATKDGKMTAEQRKVIDDFIASRDKQSPTYMQWVQGWDASNRLVQALDASGDSRETIKALSDQAKRYPHSLLQANMTEIAGRNMANYDTNFRAAFRDAMVVNNENNGSRADIQTSMIDRAGHFSAPKQIHDYQSLLRMSQAPQAGLPHEKELTAAAINHNNALIDIQESSPKDLVSRWAAMEMRLRNIELMGRAKADPAEIKSEMLEALDKYPILRGSQRWTRQALAAGADKDADFMKSYGELTGSNELKPVNTEANPSKHLPYFDPNHPRGYYYNNGAATGGWSGSRPYQSSQSFRSNRRP